MGDKHLYFDEYKKKQYYLDENGDQVYIEAESKSDSSAKVAVIAGVFAIIVAIIGIIPLFPRETSSGETEYVPGICIISDSHFVNSVFKCGSQANDIEIAVAATLTAVAPTPETTEFVAATITSLSPTDVVFTATPQIQPSSTPTIVETSVAETLTAIAEQTLAATALTPPPTTNATYTDIPTTSSNNVLAIIQVPSTDNSGIIYRIPYSGNYTFQYVSGEYDINPADAIRSGVPEVAIFRNQNPAWVADGSSLNSQHVFVYLPLSNEQQFYFEAGETLTLIAVDARNKYYDNVGNVTYEVSFSR